MSDGRPERGAPGDTAGSSEVGRPDPAVAGRRGVDPELGGSGAPAGGGADAEGALIEVLAQARRNGFLGPGAVEAQIVHARTFWSALGVDWPQDAEALVADLGAGGGLPSLPLLVDHVGLRMVLVDASQKRTSFLVWAAVQLGLTERVEVWRGRAEAFAHDQARRGRFAAVVARGFGPPASTLECGAPLLTDGGRLVVSEPPGYRQYPVDGVARCGLSLVAQRSGCAVFVRSGPVEDGLPRPWREQERRPLFEM